MKSGLTRFIFLIILASGAQSTALGQETFTLIIQIDNVEKPAGFIMIAAYSNAATFLSDNLFRGEKYKVDQTGSTDFMMELPLGEYAISVYQDLDKNGKLDTNMFGVPTEPIGFSNNAAVRFGPPKYESARFSFEEDRQKIQITLK